MPIAELGYRRWEGPRVSALLRWLAITRSHVGIAYRNSKLLRRFLIAAWFPILYFGPVFFAVGYVADPANDLAEGGILAQIGMALLNPQILEEVRTHPDVLLPAIWTVAFFFFFSLTQFLSMIVIAIVAPPLISRDVRSKAFLLYFSKPIGTWEYLLGKLSVALFFIFSITLFPGLLLYAISIAFSPDFGTLVATAPIIVRIVLGSLMMAVPVSLVALLFSSLTREHRIATFGWMALWILGEVAYGSIAAAATIGNEGDIAVPPWAFLASLRETTMTATSGVFDLTGHLSQLAEQLKDAGVNVEGLLEPIRGDAGPLQHAITVALDPDSATGVAPAPVACAVLAGVTVLCVTVILRRITRPVRV